MKLLGTLGFDWKIFLIQALNFLILFFVLKKIFFKPFTEALQKEKEKSERLQQAEELIEREKTEWEKEKAAEMDKMQSKIKIILAEAEAVAKKMTAQNENELISKEKKALEKIEHQSRAIAEDYKKSIEKRYRENFNKKIFSFFKQQITTEANRTIQDGFWEKFLKKIKALEIDKALLSTEKQGRQLTLSIVSAFSLTKKQEQELKKVIQLKTEVKKIVLEKEKNPDLIAGFSIIIGGLLVEENLKKELQELVF